MAIERFKNAPLPSAPSTAWGTLTSSMDGSTTTMAVNSKANFPAVPFRFAFGDEIGKATADAGSLTYTVQRGIEGSTAAAHASGAEVFHILTAGGLANNPGPMTAEGDTITLDASGNVVRVPVGTYLTQTLGDARYALSSALSGYQPIDADLTAIAALSTNGFAKRTGAGTWAIDSSTYLTGLAWGGITGTLSAQTDLQAALDGKLSATLPGSDTQILFNDGGALGGFGSWDGTTFNVGGVLAASAEALFGSLAAAYPGAPVFQIGHSIADPSLYALMESYWDFSPSGHNSGIFAWNSYLTVAGDALVDRAYGICLNVNVGGNSGTSTVTVPVVRGLDVDLFGLSPATTVGTAHSIHIENPEFTAQLENYVGLYIDHQNGVTVSGVNQFINADNKFIVDVSGAVTATGPIAGSNLSGTNTGDQNLSAYALSANVVPNTRTVNGSALSSNVTISTITGNAGTATALQNARTINGVSFDGTGNITVTAAPTAHNLLSASHGDTLAASVVRGDVLIGNSTPAWARLAKPSVLSSLSHDGTDVSWVTSNGTGNPVRTTSPVLVTPTLGVATATSVQCPLTGSTSEGLLFSSTMSIWGFSGPETFVFRAGSNTVFTAAFSTTTGLNIGSTLPLQWNGDTRVYRKAAHVLAMENGANAQELRITGTTTGSKYLSLKHDGTNPIIGSSSGALKVDSTAVTPASTGTRYLVIDANGVISSSAVAPVGT